MGRYDRTEAQRFWPKVDRSGGMFACWEWTAYKSKRGYGHFKVGGTVLSAHRWAWIERYGPVPEGLELDHLCRNHSCVNPAHLEAVTHQVNVQRGEAHLISARTRGTRTQCPRGHAYDNANTYVYPKTGARGCRACKARQQAEHRARKKEAQHA